MATGMRDGGRGGGGSGGVVGLNDGRRVCVVGGVGAGVRI